MKGLVAKRKFVHQKWMGFKFSPLKFASATEKGAIGENFLFNILRGAGFRKVEMPPGRRGAYDVKVARGDKILKFECKVATLDINASFQFNGIRYDTSYTHLFCLGVTPDDVYFLIIPKQDLGEAPHKMVRMAKNTNSTFKLTKKKDGLMSFDKFAKEVRKAFIKAPASKSAK